MVPIGPAPSVPLSKRTLVKGKRDWIDNRARPCEDLP